MHGRCCNYGQVSWSLHPPPWSWSSLHVTVVRFLLVRWVLMLAYVMHGLGGLVECNTKLLHSTDLCVLWFKQAVLSLPTLTKPLLSGLQHGVRVCPATAATTCCPHHSCGCRSQGNPPPAAAQVWLLGMRCSPRGGRMIVSHAHVHIPQSAAGPIKHDRQHDDDAQTPVL